MGATGYTTDPAAVDSVNGRTGTVVLTAGDLAAVALAQTVAEADTVFLNRPTTQTEGADVWQARYNGARGLYANGYACARARATVADQYAFRAQAHSGAGVNQAIGSFALSDNTDKLVTRVNGDTEIARDVLVGRNVVATGTVAGSNLQNGAWTAPASFGANVASDTSAGQAAVGARLETLADAVRLRGRLGISGSVSSGATLATLPAGLVPSSAQVINTRTGGTGAAAAFLTIGTDGTISVNTALSSGSWVTLDNLSFPR